MDWSAIRCEKGDHPMMTPFSYSWPTAYKIMNNRPFCIEWPRVYSEPVEGPVEGLLNKSIEKCHHGSISSGCVQGLFTQEQQKILKKGTRPTKQAMHAEPQSSTHLSRSSILKNSKYFPRLEHANPKSSVGLALKRRPLYQETWIN